MQRFIKAAIVLFSESIWVYFTLSLFISIEKNETIFVHAMWWFVAGLISYFFNRIIAGKVHYGIILFVNGVLMMFLIYFNWQAAISKAAWGIGIIISIALGFVFVRSAILVYKEPTRLLMLQRFEINIFIYIVIGVIFFLKNWENVFFHPFFLIAIFASLFGMTLTLESHEQTHGKKDVETYRAGNSRGFLSIISLLFTSVIVVCSVMFLPIVREKLQEATFIGLQGITWFFQHVGNFLKWIFSLLDSPESRETLPDMEPEGSISVEEMTEETMISIPYLWIFSILGIILLFILIWIFSRFLKGWRPHTDLERKNIVRKHSIWNVFWQKWVTLLRKWKGTWRAKFSRFYLHEVYWYFTQVRKWGEKNRLLQRKFETTKEYLNKVIQSFEENDIFDLSAEEKKQIIHQLQTLNDDYQAVYYGNKERVPSHNYKQLLDQLHKLSFKNNR